MHHLNFVCMMYMKVVCIHTHIHACYVCVVEVVMCYMNVDLSPLQLLACT